MTPTMTPTIQRATPAEIPALGQIAQAAGLFPAELLPDLIAPAFEDPETALWLTCQVDTRPLGFCFSQPEQMTEGTWNMRALAVMPSHQGKSLGRALVQATEIHLRDANQRLLIVDTSGTDAFALTRKFYAKSGYEVEARIRDFWAAGDDKVTFRKAL